MLKILQINYKLKTPVVDFMKASASVADALAGVPGLRWKIWLTDEAKQEGGGIYLFENLSSLKAFLEGPIVSKLKTHPSMEDLHIKLFDVPLDLTIITRGPIELNT